MILFRSLRSRRNIFARITIKENNQVTLQAFGNARGRGNYTRDGYPKKPYKIKFDEKQAVCGFPANKDWVLLSDYCDKSLLRTACMCDISEALQIDYPVRYRHVHLYLNGEYKGVYLLTDQIERKSGRSSSLVSRWSRRSLKTSQCP